MSLISLLYRLVVSLNGFDIIEVIRDYVYLGIIMKYNNKFDEAMGKTGSSRFVDNFFFAGKSKQKYIANRH